MASFRQRRVSTTPKDKLLSPRRCVSESCNIRMVAYGVIDAVRGAGFTIPGDYSVCGFDNIFPSGFTGVALTTVEHYMRDKGRNALEILHNKISGAASDRNITRVEYSHKLITRTSTAAPRAGG